MGVDVARSTWVVVVVFVIIVVIGTWWVVIVVEASQNAQPGTIKCMQFTFSIDQPAQTVPGAPVKKPNTRPSTEFAKQTWAACTITDGEDVASLLLLLLWTWVVVVALSSSVVSSTWCGVSVVVIDMTWRLSRWHGVVDVAWS